MEPQAIVYEESLRGGQMWSRVVRRGQVLRLTDLEGGACVAGLFYNAEQPFERYNMPDTLKAQQIAMISAGTVLYSDMGRILFSVIGDSVGWHDTITGSMNAEASRKRFGSGTYQKLQNDFYRNTRDNFLVELGKHGLGARDIVANLNFFVKVAVDDDGSLAFVPGHSPPGGTIDLRAELNVLTVLSATPHPLDPSERYAPRPVKVTVWRDNRSDAFDECRTRCAENERGYLLTEAYFS